MDHVSAAAFGSTLDLQIERARSDIRNGSFRFQKLRLAPVEKSSGDFRIIAVPTVRDRLVQRVLLAHLEKDKRFRASAVSKTSFGFTKGKTLADAQREAQRLRDQKNWVLQADIIKFFDNIPRDHVKKKIASRVRSKIIRALLYDCVDCELDYGGKGGAKIAAENGIVRGKGLRQGMPVSPVISNILLRDFDRALERCKITAIRYADDLAIFADSRSACEDALRIVERELAKVQLMIPKLGANSKTTICSPSEAVTFLGVEIRRHGSTYQLHAPVKKMNSIIEKIMAQATLKTCVEEQWDIGKVAQTLDRFIIGHKAAMAVLDDPTSFFERLEAAKGRAITQLLVEIVGEKTLKNMDDNKMAVLGVRPFQPTQIDKKRRRK